MNIFSRKVIVNLIRFILLMFFQVLILNNIRLGGYINPYYYVYFILLLPFETPRWILLVSSFLLGFGIDIFSNTIGLNAAACVLMSFSRSFVIKIISAGPENLVGTSPALKNQGIRWFLSYVVSLVFLHHSTLFYLEVFRLNEFFYTLLRVLLSTSFTVLLILISEYFRYQIKK